MSARLFNVAFVAAGALLACAPADDDEISERLRHVSSFKAEALGIPPSAIHVVRGVQLKLTADPTDKVIWHGEEGECCEGGTFRYVVAA